MERLSLHLWSILNRYIGCKEQIHIRRRNVCFYETVCNYNNRVRGTAVERVLSGSRGEGMDLEDSDYDYMVIMNKITVLPDSTPTQASDFLVETENIKPGFARLRLSNEPILSMDYGDIVTRWNDGLYLSSLFDRDSCVEICNKGINPGSYAHGPCSTHLDRLIGTENDKLTCYRCMIWPSVASEWVHRYRPNNWPSRELVNEITEDGYLLVPVGNPLSPTGFMEWRLSFSLAERKLVYSFNHTQFLCYGLLKLFLKHVINSNVTTKDLLCSYFIKTIIFHVIEEEPLIWDKQYIFICFWTCFKRLLLCVRQGSCPNYFVKHNNMFEAKIVGMNKETLLHYLSSLYSEHFEVLARIPFFTPLFKMGHFNTELLDLPAPEENDKEIEYRCFREVGSIMVDCPKTLHEGMIMQCYIQTESFRTITDIHDKEISVTWMYKLHYLHTQYLYHLYLNRRLSNKSRYRYLNMLKCHILHNCTGGDICTGWLQYTTLCYLTGNYERVVRLMDYVLSKFKPYTIGSGLMKNLKCFIETICGKNLSISSKRRIASALLPYILTECEFYPPEIKPEILNHANSDGAIYITPLIYVYVLKFLSFHKLGCGEHGAQALDKVNDILSGDFDSRLLPVCFDIVGKCRSLVN